VYTAFPTVLISVVASRSIPFANHTVLPREIFRMYQDFASVTLHYKASQQAKPSPSTYLFAMTAYSSPEYLKKQIKVLMFSIDLSKARLLLSHSLSGAKSQSKAADDAIS
jgi:hypothetical protein